MMHFTSKELTLCGPQSGPPPRGISSSHSIVRFGEALFQNRSDLHRCDYLFARANAVLPLLLSIVCVSCLLV